MQSNLAPHRQVKRLQMSEEMMPSMSVELGDKVACNRWGLRGVREVQASVEEGFHVDLSHMWVVNDDAPTTFRHVAD